MTIPNKAKEKFKNREHREKFDHEVSELIKVTRNLRDMSYVIAAILGSIFILIFTYLWAM